MKRWTVPQDREGERLGTFLAKEYQTKYSGKQIKQALEKNACWVNGKIERHASYVLLMNDQITFSEQTFILERKEEDRFDPTKVLFEDEYFLAYDKPHGMTSEDLSAMLKKECDALFLVHRLDRDTTGVILFAKSQDILDRFITLFDQKRVKKDYLAIVVGKLSKKSGTMDNTLGKVYQKGDYVMWGAVSPQEGGVRAITEWECLVTKGLYSLMSCYPYTGRTHQIRVHMDQLGCPIVGDSRYGKDKKSPILHHIPRCMLHARHIFFPHPVKDYEVEVSSPIPEDMLNLLVELKLCKL